MDHEHAPQDYPREAKANLNTILLAIALAVMMFIGAKTVETSEKLAGIAAGQVTRGEVESKLESIRKDYVDILARVTSLERGERQAGNK